MQIKTMLDARAWVDAWDGKPPEEWVEIAAAAVARDCEPSAETERVIVYLREHLPLRTPVAAPRRVIPRV